MKNKKGLSEIVTTIILVLLVLVVVGIVWKIVALSLDSQEPKCKIFLNETEVDELVACCFDTEVNNFSLDEKTYCMPEENLEFYEVPCKPLKEDLTIEWLDLNANCVSDNKIFNQEERDKFVRKCNKKCGFLYWGMFGKDMDKFKICWERCSPYTNFDEERFEYYKIVPCQEYKFGKYTIEVSK